jgi:hemerythrin
MATSHKWNKEKYSVNIDEIDEQHRFLFDIINELEDIIESKSDVQAVGDLLKKLQKYAIFHFLAEEKILREYNYPKLKKHTAEHASFIDKMDRFNADFSRNKLEVSKELSDYLFYWLFFHIQCDDKDYSQFLISKQAG